MQIKLPDDTSLWARRLALYFSLYVLIIGSHLFFSRFDWWHTDVDSARYMLSALVQSEAAIVALVVTLSLVAVQLAAQSYSARVIEVFRKAPDLWILMGIYGISIFYGLGVLKMIERVNPQLCAKEYICLSNLEGHILGAYYLGVFAFVALVPYMWKMFDMLKPSTVIDMLSKRITKQNILTAIRKGEEKSGDNDPIQPIIDIVRCSLMKYDYETVRYGLEAIGNRCNHIFSNENFKVEEEKKISEHIFTHLTRVGKLAVSKEDDDSTRQVISTLYKNGITAAKNELKETVHKASSSIRFIGTSAAEKGLEASTEKAASSLEEIGKALVEKNLEINTKEAGWWEAKFLEEIGVKAAEYNMENAVNVVLGYLGELGMEAAKKNLNNTIQNIASSIDVVRKEAAKQKIEGTNKLAAEALGYIDLKNVDEKIASDINKKRYEASKLEQK